MYSEKCAKNWSGRENRHEKTKKTKLVVESHSESKCMHHKTSAGATHASCAAEPLQYFLVDEFSVLWIGQRTLDEKVDEVATWLDSNDHAFFENCRRPQTLEPKLLGALGAVRQVSSNIVCIL